MIPTPMTPSMVQYMYMYMYVSYVLALSSHIFFNVDHTYNDIHRYMYSPLMKFNVHILYTITHHVHIFQQFKVIKNLH